MPNTTVLERCEIEGIVSFAHQGPTSMGWTSYWHGGKQNTKGTLLRGAGRWSAFTRRSAQEVQGCLEIQPESM